MFSGLSMLVHLPILTFHVKFHSSTEAFSKNMVCSKLFTFILATLTLCSSNVHGTKAETTDMVRTFAVIVRIYVGTLLFILLHYARAWIIRS